MKSTKTLLSRATIFLLTSSSELPLLHTRFLPLRIHSSIFLRQFQQQHFVAKCECLHSSFYLFTSIKFILFVYVFSKRRKMKEKTIVLLLLNFFHLMNLNHGVLRKTIPSIRKSIQDC